MPFIFSKMKKIRAAVVGYGNIGQYTLEALEAAPDFEIAGVVRRDASDRKGIAECIPVVDDIEKLDDVDVAILATPTRKVEENAVNAWRRESTRWTVLISTLKLQNLGRISAR